MAFTSEYTFFLESHNIYVFQTTKESPNQQFIRLCNIGDCAVKKIADNITLLPISNSVGKIAHSQLYQRLLIKTVVYLANFDSSHYPSY